MNEKYLENKIKKYLKSKNHYYIKVHGSGFGKSGIPDIIACVGGVFVGFEIKNPNKKGKVSTLQKFNIEAIRKSKGFAFVIDDYKDFISIMDVIEKGV